MTLPVISFMHQDYWDLFAKVTFDGVNKLIFVVPEILELNVKEDLYSAWKEWSLVRDNLKWDPALRVVGGDPISPTRSLGASYFLINGWRIKPWRGKYSLTVDGNLYTEEGDSPYILADDPAAVNILQDRSNLVDEIGVINPVTASDTANAVWSANTDSISIGGNSTFGELLVNMHSANIVATGSIASGSTNTILQTNFSKNDDYFNGMAITIVDSDAGNVITRQIDQSYSNGQINIIGVLPFVPSDGSSIIVTNPHVVNRGAIR